MNKTVHIRDKEFALYITEQEIIEAISRMAAAIKCDIEGQNPLFVCILSGAYMFTAELLHRISPACEVIFAAYRSYTGDKSDGIIQEILPIHANFQQRLVILLEDIVDTGQTMYHVVNQLKASGAQDVRLATMLFKPRSLKCDLKIDYVGMEIDDAFVVGFGLDYDGLGRTTRDIYKVINN